MDVYHWLYDHTIPFFNFDKIYEFFYFEYEFQLFHELSYYKA